MDFLTELFDEGKQYSAINTARSALSTIISLPGQIPFGKHPMVSRFLKGVFQLKPALPRYVATWDVGVVLQYLRKLPNLTDISLKQLTHKLTMMLVLLSGQRTQTLTLLDIKNITVTSSCCIFYINGCLKHTRPGTHQAPLEIPAYPQDTNICIKAVLSKYLEMTKDKRGRETQLLISFQKRFKPVTVDTLSRWIKTIMSQAGIDIDRFKPYSGRAASTSAAKATNVPIHTIMAAAGWSRESTFAKFYNKAVTQSGQFGQSILDTKL